MSAIRVYPLQKILPLQLTPGKGHMLRGALLCNHLFFVTHFGLTSVASSWTGNKIFIVPWRLVNHWKEDIQWNIPPQVRNQCKICYMYLLSVIDWWYNKGDKKKKFWSNLSLTYLPLISPGSLSSLSVFVSLLRTVFTVVRAVFMACVQYLYPVARKYA